MHVETLLTDDILSTVADVTISLRWSTDVEKGSLADLCEAQVLRVEKGSAKPYTAFFLEQDLKVLRQASKTLGPALAEAVEALDRPCQGLEPALTRCLVGYRGIDAGTFRILLDGGYAWNHRELAGKYATAKIDVYEVCDTYDSFGSYLSGGYGFAGEHYAVHVLGEDGGIHAYLRAGLSLTDDRQYRFLMSANRYLTDSLGALLAGEISNPHLREAAEEAGFLAGDDRG